jgi:hypothetical protein
MSARYLGLVMLLSALLLSHSSSVRSSKAQAQNSTAPRLTLNVTDWWNAPVAINSVRIGDQEVLPGSSIEASGDWVKNLSIEATNKSEKTISYIAYAVDFTIAGEDSLYRFRLQDGTFYSDPEALTAPGGLRVLRRQKHVMRFSDNTWKCHSTLVGMINERRARIVKAELFVETVGFTDDTLWTFGSRLQRNKETSFFESVEGRETSLLKNVEYGGLAKRKNQLSANLARGFLAKEPSATTLRAGCCAANPTIRSGQARVVQVLVACSSCPPSAGGGTCSFPPPNKMVNSFNGPGNDGPDQISFSVC